MSKIDEVKAELTKLDIAFDENASLKELRALLPEGDNSGEGEDSFEIGVKDPEAFRPTELPLLITPPEGQDWKNDEQAIYAKTLNAYAYRNPTKWLTRKDVEIARLIEIGKNPAQYYVYSGEVPGGSNIKVGSGITANKLD